MAEKPQLPGHIQAAIDRNLARQNLDAFGRPADSAGTAWQGRDLTGPGIDGSSNPLHAFDTDNGLEDEAWTKVSQDLIAGHADEKDVFNVLQDIRVFAAVIPTVAESTVETRVDQHGHEFSVAADKEADVALVSLTAADGRGALPVFTSIPKLTAWHKDARPVAVWMPRACLSAVDEGNEIVVIDPGAHLTFVVRRPAVYALAQQKPWTPSYEDVEIAQALSELTDLIPGLAQLAMAPGRGVGTQTDDGKVIAGGGAGPELALVATPHDPADTVGNKLMLTTLQSLIADVTLLAERADTVEIVLGGSR
ncbi:MAG TPA: SseB family protein [Enteractinococcus sp.]